jgi:hypothetical protein
MVFSFFPPLFQPWLLCWGTMVSQKPNHGSSVEEAWFPPGRTMVVRGKNHGFPMDGPWFSHEETLVCQILFKDWP